MRDSRGREFDADVPDLSGRGLGRDERQVALEPRALVPLPVRDAAGKDHEGVRCRRHPFQADLDLQGSLQHVVELVEGVHVEARAAPARVGCGDVERHVRRAGTSIEELLDRETRPAYVVARRVEPTHGARPLARVGRVGRRHDRARRERPRCEHLEVELVDRARVPVVVGCSRGDEHERVGTRNVLLAPELHVHLARDDVVELVNRMGVVRRRRGTSRDVARDHKDALAVVQRLEFVSLAAVGAEVDVTQVSHGRCASGRGRACDRRAEWPAPSGSCSIRP